MVLVRLALVDDQGTPNTQTIDFETVYHQLPMGIRKI
jgi:hypothetical protein